MENVVQFNLQLTILIQLLVRHTWLGMQFVAVFFHNFHFFPVDNPANTELVLINFYADWCRFSNMLAPIFDEAADKVSSEFPSSKVVLGKVDCDKESKMSYYICYFI